MNRRRVSPLAALLLLAAAAAGAAADQGVARKATPPPPQPDKEIRFPAFEQKALGNGLRLVVIEQHETPAVSAQLILPAGKLYESPAKAGLASATADLLTQGTESRSAQEIARAIDFVGGTLAASSGGDTAVASVAVTSDQLELGLELLADVVLHPSFPQEEIDRWRRQALSNLQIQEDDPAYLARTAFARAVFGEHPYGQPTSGTPDSVRGLTREDFVAFHRRHYLPNSAILAIVGDVKPADAFTRAERFFGGWKRGEEPAAPAFQASRRTSPKIVVIDKPDAVQTQVVVGQAAIPYKDPSFFAAQVYDAVVGGASSSRLYEEVRQKRGLSYGAYSSMDPRRQTGLFVASTSTKTESTVEALAQVLEVLRGMAEKPVPHGELEARQAYITGAFPLEIETPQGIAAKVVEAMFYGLGKEFLESYRQRIDAVTAEEVQRFAAGPVDPKTSTVVLVGNAKAFAAELEKKFGAFEIIPAAELDLLRADLRRAEEQTAAAPVSEADQARARELLDKAREALGGKAFIEQKTQISRGSGTFSPPGAPQPMPIRSLVVYEVFPARSRGELALPFGQVVQAFDGQVGWVSAMGQVEDQTAQLSQEQYFGFNALRRFDRGVYGARPLPDAEVDGKRVRGVELSDAAGHTTRFFLDPQSHLVVKTSYQAGGRTNETIYSDYKPVAGVQIPHTMKVFQDGTPMMEIRLAEVEVDPPIDEAIFKKPS